jgi:ribosomal protein L22
MMILMKKFKVTKEEKERIKHYKDTDPAFDLDSITTEWRLKHGLSPKKAVKFLNKLIKELLED